jgi:hypothetical protein
MAKRRAPKVQRKYTTGLSASTVAKRKAQIRKRIKGAKKDRFAPLAGDAKAKTRPSVHTKSLGRFREAVSQRSSKSRAKTPKAKFISSVAGELKIPASIVREVYEKGEAAWAVGHRPGATQSQWAKARVYSFVRKGNTVTKGPDEQLYTKAKKAQKGGAFFKLR